MSTERADLEAMVETARGTLHEWQRDHMGHINVRAYMEKFEEACWQLYAMLGLSASVLRGGDVRMAAVQQNITYRKELYPGDTIMVRTGIVEMRDKVLRFVHELVNTETGEVNATCEFTVVCIDPRSRKSRAFPEQVRQRYRELVSLPQKEASS